jgi:hypothetical protein
LYWKGGGLGPWLMDHLLLWSTVDQETDTTVGTPKDDRLNAMARWHSPVVAGEEEGGGVVHIVGKKGDRGTDVGQ